MEKIYSMDTVFNRDTPEFREGYIKEHGRITRLETLKELQSRIPRGASGAEIEHIISVMLDEDYPKSK